MFLKKRRLRYKTLIIRLEACVLQASYILAYLLQTDSENYLQCIRLLKILFLTKKNTPYCDTTLN